MSPTQSNLTDWRMAMDWPIIPHFGMGSLRFGMSPPQVAKLPGLGVPQTSHREWDGSVSEFRSLGQPQLSYADYRLRDNDTDYRVGRVLFDDLDVYGVEPEVVIRRLMASNGGSALVGAGSLLFTDIGINTGGFYDEKSQRFARLSGAEPARSLAVFAPGAFNAMVADMLPFEWPRR